MFSPLKSRLNNSSHIDSTSICWVVTLPWARAMGVGGTQEPVLQWRVLAPIDWWCTRDQCQNRRRSTLPLEIVPRTPVFFWKGRFNMKGDIWIEPFKKSVKMSLQSHLPQPLDWGCSVSFCLSCPHAAESLPLPGLPQDQPQHFEQNMIPSCPSSRPGKK